MLKPWPLKIIIDSVLGGQPPPWGWPSGWSSQALLLAACPALFVVIARLNSRITHVAGDVRQRESEVYAVVQQSMSMMRVTQAFTREEEEHRRFMDVSRQSLAAGLRLYTLQTVYSSVVNV